jgi:hypothetical protein
MNPFVHYVALRVTQEYDDAHVRQARQARRRLHEPTSTRLRRWKRSQPASADCGKVQVSTGVLN